MNMSEYFGSSFLMLLDTMEILHEKALRLSSPESYKFLESLSRKQAKALYIVSKKNEIFPAGMCLKELAQALNLTTPATSILVETLVKKGALARCISPKDRRAICITVTSFGEKIYDILCRNMANFSAFIIEDLSEEERINFHRMMEIFYNRAQKYIDQYLSDQKVS